jgi:hypothetical protein
MVAYHLWTMEHQFDELFKKSPRNERGDVIVSTCAVLGTLIFDIIFHSCSMFVQKLSIL